MAYRVRIPGGPWTVEEVATMRGNSRQFAHRQVRAGNLPASVIGDSIMIAHDNAAGFGGVTSERAEELWPAVAAEVERRRELAAAARQAAKSKARPTAKAKARTRRLRSREAQPITA
jgi:hypothetical protein